MHIKKLKNLKNNMGMTINHSLYQFHNKIKNFIT